MTLTMSLCPVQNQNRMMINFHTRIQTQSTSHHQHQSQITPQLVRAEARLTQYPSIEIALAWLKILMNLKTRITNMARNLIIRSFSQRGRTPLNFKT